MFFNLDSWKCLYKAKLQTTFKIVRLRKHLFRHWKRYIEENKNAPVYKSINRVF